MDIDTQNVLHGAFARFDLLLIELKKIRIALEGIASENEKDDK